MSKADASFGTWLKSRRKTLDMTQEELAQEVGCATVTIRKIEANALRPSSQIALRLAQCCSIPEAEHDAFVRFARSEQTDGHVWVDKTPGAPSIRFEADRPQNNLTDLPNPLIGREQELEQIRQRLLKDSVRLLTLIGPPGVGKTRLALQIAQELLEVFRDGVFVLPLAPVTSPQQVLETLANTLGIKESGMVVLSEEIKDYLYDKEVLLVLDNFEQVLDAAPLIDSLLQTCYGVKALVTSREVLRLRRERRFNVSPLSLPDTKHTADVNALLEIPAVALFVERAQAANSAFEINEQNAADIAAVCVQLDGLPLSIELIAARSMLLSPKAMLRHLDNQLALLTSKSYDHPKRQQTLRDAIAWSYELLEPDEQALFASLGVFPDSFTLSATEAIVGGESPMMVLDQLSALVDKSLLLARTDIQPEMRFEMLQVLREYAREQLEQQPVHQVVNQRFADYYTDLATDISTKLTGGQQREMLQRLEQESYNLQATLKWLIDQHQITKAMRLTNVLSDFWHIRGLITEGRRWLEELLKSISTSNETIPVDVRIDTLNAAGFLAYHQSDYLTAHQFFAESLALIQASPDQSLVARVYHNLGLTDLWLGQFSSATDLIQQSLALWRTENEHIGIANAFCNLGAVRIEQGHYDQAHDLLIESLALWNELGTQRGIAATLLHLGKLELIKGQLTAANQRIIESQHSSITIGSKTGIASATIYRGAILLHQLAFDEAVELLNEGLDLAKEIGNKQLASLALRLLGRIASEQEHFAQAELLLAESLHLCDTMGYKAGTADTNVQRGWLALRQQRYAQSLELAQAAFALFQAIEQPAGLLSALELLALLHAANGDYASAARTWAQVHHGRHALAMVRTPLDERTWQQARATLAQQLGPETLQQLLDTPPSEHDTSGLLFQIISA